MRLANSVLAYFTIFFNLYILIKAYQNTVKSKAKLNKIDFIILLSASSINYLCNNYVHVLLKIPVSVMVLMLSFELIFKEDFITLLFKTFILYLMLMLCDLLVSIIFLFFPVSSVLDIGKITIIKILDTILVSLLLMLLYLCRPLVNFVIKLINYISLKCNVIATFLLVLLFIVFVILAIFSATSFEIEVFFITVLLIFCFLFLAIVLIFQYFKNKSNEEEQKALLSLMNEYEKVLDNERSNRHEMLNNLIILKSYNDKSSLEYEETIDDIIRSYQDKKSDLYSNLYKLPSGIKGIIYYKMFKIKENNINLNLLSSPDIENNFKKLNSKLYFKVCKILGIVLDNAIEASSITKDKILLIDIYYEDGLIIYIENSYNNTININDIYHKGVSSKGANRGYGLYIVKKLLEETNLLEFNQYLENNRFITVLKIKNPS